LKSLGISVVNLQISDDKIFKFFDLPLKMIMLAIYLKREKTDIVHTHLLYADIVGRYAACLAGVKKIISTEHNQVGYGGYLKRLLLRFVDKRTMAFVAVSRDVRGYLLRERNINERRITIINNGIETEKFAFPDRVYNKRELVIGAMGKVSRQKGFDQLIEALALVDRDYVCKIAGDNDIQEYKLRSQLEKKIISLGLQEKISFIGVQDAPQFFASIDIFVSASRWDGLSLVLLEAGASGLPIAAFDVGGVRSVIDDGEDGFVVKSGDIRKLAERISELLDKAELRERFGRSIAKMVKNNFDITEVAMKYENLYIANHQML
jgi:glycosyltransferase involved in cell wall biosynthesis